MPRRRPSILRRCVPLARMATRRQRKRLYAKRLANSSWRGPCCKLEPSKRVRPWVISRPIQPPKSGFSSLDCTSGTIGRLTALRIGFERPDAIRSVTMKAAVAAIPLPTSRRAKSPACGRCDIAGEVFDVHGLGRPLPRGLRERLQPVYRAAAVEVGTIHSASRLARCG